MFTLTGPCIFTGLQITLSALCWGWLPRGCKALVCPAAPNSPCMGTHPRSANPSFPVSHPAGRVAWPDTDPSGAARPHHWTEQTCLGTLPHGVPGACERVVVAWRMQDGDSHHCPSDLESGIEHCPALMDGQVWEVGSDLTYLHVQSTVPR